jgi:hypothetical protein
MGILENQVSNRLFKVDNDLAPFYKSVSCWSVVVVWMAVLITAIRKYPHWQVADQLFFLYLLLATATAVVGLLFYSRRHQANYLKKNQQAESALELLRFLSRRMVSLAMVLQMVVLFVIGSR